MISTAGAGQRTGEASEGRPPSGSTSTRAAGLYGDIENGGGGAGGDSDSGSGNNNSSDRLSGASGSLASGTAAMRYEALGRAGYDAERALMRERGASVTSCCCSRTWMISAIIVLMGAAASAAFLYLGIAEVHERTDAEFATSSAEAIREIEAAWRDYERGALWLHQGMAVAMNGTSALEKTTALEKRRKRFRELYEHVASGDHGPEGHGLDLQMSAFAPNVSHGERQALEDDSRAYYGSLLRQRNITYRGFVGFEDGDGNAVLQPRSEQPFYFPYHYLEPLEGNEAAIDYDVYSSGPRRDSIDRALRTWKPTATSRLRLVQEKDPSAYSVNLLHPGIPLSTRPDLRPRDIALMSVRMPALLRRATRKWGRSGSVYLYDSTDASRSPEFLGAVDVVAVAADGRSLRKLAYQHAHRTEHDYDGGSPDLVFPPERDIESLRDSRSRVREQVLRVADRDWTVVVLAPDGNFETSFVFMIVGGAVLFVASLAVAYWVHSNTSRVEKLNALKYKAETAALLAENARKATENERELNDFISHEVRNPLASAMAACSFVKASVYEEVPLSDETARNATREDVDVIENSLQYVNSLLKNMLDMNRASRRQMVINLEPVDVLEDILEPIVAILYHREKQFEVLLDCPTDGDDRLVVLSDRLRLGQIVLNLSQNSARFIPEGGYLRLRAAVDEEDGNVRISVEDSGPGIPESKRDRLFCKFQQSLESLNQGTGIGLYLCKKLIRLMGGDIYLDEKYQSGVEGWPGSRFVVDLKLPPLPRSARGGPDGSNSGGSLREEKGEEKDEENLQHQQSERTLSCSLSTTAGGASSSGADCSEASHSPPRPQKPIAAPPPQEPADPPPASPLREDPAPRQLLPEKLSVLFVDDDRVLRKLFSRTVRKVAPTWTVREAECGEDALNLVDKEHFDLIFMDNYMPNPRVESPLLGSDTVRKMRSSSPTNSGDGANSITTTTTTATTTNTKAVIICGLSANDVEDQFMGAGADCFMFKPFPCSQDEMTSELLRVLGSKSKKEKEKTESSKSSKPAELVPVPAVAAPP